MIDVGHEAQFLTGLVRIAEALAGTVPVPRRRQRDRGRVAGERSCARRDRESWFRRRRRDCRSRLAHLSAQAISPRAMSST